MSTTIKPTVGRVVWFHPAANERHADFSPPAAGQPLAAIVAAVLAGHPVDVVNLTVFDAVGNPHSRTMVPLIQEDSNVPDDGYFATWMPYQVEQAKKAEAKPEAAASYPAAQNQSLRLHALDMALRTPGLNGHDDMLKAARAYQAHIEGERTLPASHPVQQLADAVGGTIESLERLPDGSGACVLSMPLPANHWLTQPGFNEPPMPFQRGTDDATLQDWAEKIRAAARYAVRASTMNGAIDDFDPDAMVRNFVVGMIGYFTPDGTSSTSDLVPEPAAPDTSGLPG